MKVKNMTRYPTATLRSMLCEVHNRLAKHEGRLRSWSRLRVEVSHVRGVRKFAYGVSGRASYGGDWMQLRLSRGAVDSLRVYALMEHELTHSYGYKHGPGLRGSNGFEPSLLASWESAAEKRGRLVEVESEPKLKRDVREVRHERTLASITRWEAKLKRASDALKKLNARRRYYEKTLPVAAGRSS